MSEEENKALIHRYFEQIDAAAKDKRGASVLDDFIAPEFVNHDPSPGFTPDLDGLKQAFNHFLAAQPDGYHVVEDMFAEGDKVVTRLSAVEGQRANRSCQTGNRVSQHDVGAGSGQGVLRLADRAEHPVGWGLVTNKRE